MAPTMSPPLASFIEAAGRVCAAEARDVDRIVLEGLALFLGHASHRGELQVGRGDVTQQQQGSVPTLPSGPSGVVERKVGLFVGGHSRELE